MRISDWSSDVCSSDLLSSRAPPRAVTARESLRRIVIGFPSSSPERRQQLANDANDAGQQDDCDYAGQNEDHQRDAQLHRQLVGQLLGSHGSAVPHLLGLHHLGLCAGVAAAVGLDHPCVDFTLLFYASSLVLVSPPLSSSYPVFFVIFFSFLF